MNSRAIYGAGAIYYDVFAGEFIYRVGRVLGERALGLRPGDVVLDLGCGTGLNFALLVDAVGPTGRVIGLDRSAAMLSVAGRRIEREQWRNVSLVRADATSFDADDLGTSEIDAVFSTYAMSVTDDPEAVWACAGRALRPGGRACIVDMQVPTGRAAILAPLARLACAMGGSDIEAHPWTLLEADGKRVQRFGLRGNHIQVVSGFVP